MTRAYAFGVRLLAKAKQFASHAGGAAAIEFAIIVPVFAGLVVALDSYANLATGTAEMQTGARSAIQYAMHGGTDMNAAKTLGMQAWNNKPADATMNVVQACLCGNTASACNQPCADGSYPTSFVTVTASGTFGGAVYRHTNQITEKVRLR